LRDLPLLDDDYRHEFAQLANGYLDTIHPDAYEQVTPLQAICAYLLTREDWDNLLPAVDSLANKDKISAPLVERDGRIYWCEEHLDDEFGRKVLDVTDLGLHAKAIDRMFLRNALTSYEVRDGAVSLSGAVVNPLGRIKPGAKLGAELEFRARRKVGVKPVSFPVASVTHEGGTIAWSATADLAAQLRPVGVVDAVWDVRLHLDVDGVRTTTRLSVVDPDLVEGALPVRPRLTRMVADHLEPEVSPKGHLAFCLVSHDRRSEALQAFIDRRVQGAPGQLAKTGVRKAKKVRGKLASTDTKLRLYHEVFSKLPVKKGLVVFESHLGKQYSDSPKAIYEEMRRQGVDFEAVWSYEGKPKGFPKDATLVRRWSLPYLKALAQAEFWVDNQGFPLKLTKRPETTYIQTWHGSALKRMGFDEAAWKLKSKPQQDELQRTLDRFDRFLVRTEHDVRTLARAFRLKESVLLRTGYPRNDALVRAKEREDATGTRERGPLAEQLGIPADKQVLLYAPTFRQRGNGSKAFELPFDVEEFAERFGDRYVLLVRSHYLNHVTLPPSVRGKVVDVSSSVPDVTPVLELADALITDYSSIMFDYALLDRPVFLFAYDYEEYVEERGAYWDIFENAPGPVVRTAGELFEGIVSLESSAREHAADRKRFVAEFGEYDTGSSARRIVDEFFSHRRNG
ncbi:CDP-glycerol glycerophosphotransferase family protein, partial [Streptomyces sp. NPDC101118]|uniref:CDP-glycerol glycerophosphotransferase family protein n=1 Tax=Streptomyces sp. NPDC101118 TaxID=3366109 RepID=UPI00381B46CF